jgi:hypothetical protein
LSISEAQAKGIDVNHIAEADGETDTVSPVGTKPPAAAVSDLEEKVQELKLNSGSASAHYTGGSRGMPTF